MYQPQAWFDDDTCVAWALQESKLVLENCDAVGANVMWTFDGLSGQRCDRFREWMTKLGVTLHILEPGCTDMIQLVDCGVGRALKDGVSNRMEGWLMASEDNATKWVDGFTASEKRVMMTKWAADAWEDMCTGSARFDFEGAGRRCGLLQSIDGSVPLRPQGVVEDIRLTEADCSVVLPLDSMRKKRYDAAAARSAATSGARASSSVASLSASSSAGGPSGLAGCGAPTGTTGAGVVSAPARSGLEDAVQVARTGPASAVPPGQVQAAVASAAGTEDVGTDGTSSVIDPSAIYDGPDDSDVDADCICSESESENDSVDNTKDSRSSDESSDEGLCACL